MSGRKFFASFDFVSGVLGFGSGAAAVTDEMNALVRHV
jgi:hypothetical protein